MEEGVKEGIVAKVGEKLNVSDYATSAKNSIKDGMTPDHIPSFASLKKNLESKLNRSLTEAEANKLKNETTTLLYETSIHQQFSRTYGGRNLDSQIIKILSEQEKGKTVMEICQEQKSNNYLTIKTIKNISQSATPGFVFPRQSDLPYFLIRFFPASFFCALQRFAHSNTVFQLFHLC